MKAKAKKISKGKYLYKGYVLHNCGYHQPDHRVIWEAYDSKTGNVDFHSGTKKHLMRLIDGYAGRKVKFS